MVSTGTEGPDVSRTRSSEGEVDVVKFLWHEGADLIETCDNEAKRGELTWTCILFISPCSLCV